MLKRAVLVFFTLFIFMFSFSAWGYEAGQVKDGGNIKGKVKVDGPIPQDPTFQVTKDQSVCGDTLKRQKYVISSDGGVEYAVVFIGDIAKGKAFPDKVVEISNKKCHFDPHVQVGVKGQTLGVKNDDPMLHNTHMRLGDKTVFNAALPIQGMEIKKAVRWSGLVDVRCDVHDFMHGFFYVSDNPYIAVTDAEGNFSITDIPPGSYKLKVWHEAFGTQEKSVTVNPNGSVEVDFDFKQ